MKPILFNTEMVKAILDGRKTTTRRVIKPQPICMGPNITFKPHNDDFFLSAEKGWLRCRTCGNDPEYSPEGKNISHHWKPSYQPGDVLYVRETYANIEIAGHPETRKRYYRADGNYPDGIPWRPSIFMPKEVARIFLRVTDVKATHLQNITEEGAIAEGAKEKRDFIRIWNNTIPDKNSQQLVWSANPWVWVISFERCEKPND